MPKKKSTSASASQLATQTKPLRSQDIVTEPTDIVDKKKDIVASPTGSPYLTVKNAKIPIKYIQNYPGSLTSTTEDTISRAIDNDYLTAWRPKGQVTHVFVEFLGFEKLDEVKIVFDKDTQASFDIETSTDDITWDHASTVSNVKGDGQTQHVFSITPVVTRFVRLNDIKSDSFGIVSLEFFGTTNATPQAEFVHPRGVITEQHGHGHSGHSTGHHKKHKGKQHQHQHPRTHVKTHTPKGTGTGTKKVTGKVTGTIKGDFESDSDSVASISSAKNPWGDSDSDTVSSLD